WCNGRCGTIGISWGGFNGLQIAALQPPQLKAIVTICSTDDRYADDVHYMGGCLLGDNLSWASNMLGYMTSPPDPAIVGDKWKAMWMERLEGVQPWLKAWLTHQTRDGYWKHGSICEDYSKIETPVMAVSGWSDPYTNSVFRLLENLPKDLPRMGLVGPWGHKYPHIGRPGPAIGFLQETLRWWDLYLKGEETGIDAEPMLRVYMQASMPPSTGYEHRLGRWVSEPVWPSPHIEQRSYALASDRHGLAMNADGTATDGLVRDPLTVCSPVSLGYFGGKWCGESAPPDLPDDQREEDGGALVFDSPELTEPLEILGQPVVELDLESDQPVAMVAVRLSDVLPDGRVTRLSYGLLNLTHRDGHEQPQALQPGKRYQIRAPLNYLAESFTPGHRLRIAVSTSYWPLAWLPPELTTLTIHTENSQVVLPIRHQSEDEKPVHFERPEAAPATKAEVIAATERSWKVIRDIAA
ncbi:MAG: CocE/NonD family hydrolase, partial [Pirellulaceae bacterium]